jgi:hypothetical protein
MLDFSALDGTPRFTAAKSHNSIRSLLTILDLARRSSLLSAGRFLHNLFFNINLLRPLFRLSSLGNTPLLAPVVAKELAKIVYDVVKSQQPFRTFKGIRIRQPSQLVSPRESVRLTGQPH